jgi:hypothetical protein
MDNLSTAEGLKFTSPATYRIVIKGYLDESWSERLSGMMIDHLSIEHGLPITKILGRVRDQSELIGVLNSIYDMHLPLLSLSLEDNSLIES